MLLFLEKEEWVVAYLWLPWARGVNGAADEFSAAALQLSRERGFRNVVFTKVDAQTEVPRDYLKVQSRRQREDEALLGPPLLGPGEEEELTTTLGFQLKIAEFPALRIFWRGRAKQAVGPWRKVCRDFEGPMKQANIVAWVRRCIARSVEETTKTAIGVQRIWRGLHGRLRFLPRKKFISILKRLKDEEVAEKKAEVEAAHETTQVDQPATERKRAVRAGADSDSDDSSDDGGLATMLAARGSDDMSTDDDEADDDDDDDDDDADADAGAGTDDELDEEEAAEAARLEAEYAARVAAAEAGEAQPGNTGSDPSGLPDSSQDPTTATSHRTPIVPVVVDLSDSAPVTTAAATDANSAAARRRRMMAPAQASAHGASSSDSPARAARHGGAGVAASPSPHGVTTRPKPSFPAPSSPRWGKVPHPGKATVRHYPVRVCACPVSVVVVVLTLGSGCVRVPSPGSRRRRPAHSSRARTSPFHAPQLAKAQQVAAS